ncbi:uroporphyrinogen-III synthase [Pseudovibrio axinellae]|uniref:Uroporphyrinogen-III synthase n=1 Tax=Pseudovibrio axinellae TaxID=989403 RepID=A0A166A699_9HYPH|nr:uroporphyrinogen-III synthase [Pseudovibrio axinellae]KZL20667.1 uroporphyrinogen-III synthase [Pseudovibrio axinellae]SER26333.1 uroporphyrinogen-III synthase [Pseudovibrio axinellae]
MKILVTRPQPEADKTARRLVAMGHEVVIEPMLHFQPLSLCGGVAGDAKAIAVTSAKAIEALVFNDLVSSLQQLPVFCVGDATAKAAEFAGFHRVMRAHGDVDSLAKLIVESHLKGPFFYPAAVDRSGDLAGRLMQQGVACRMVETYQMVAAAKLSQITRDQLQAGGVDCALFYSARTVQAFLNVSNLEKTIVFLNSMKALCVSKRVAEHAASFGEVLVAKTPSEESLFELLTSLQG